MAGSRFAAPVARAIGAAAVCLAQVSCYTLQAYSGRSTAPLLGQRIAVDITDAGRAALGGSMGPEILQIEGRLTRDDESEYELAVTSVHMLRGGEQTWSGEKVKVRKEFVSRMYERQFSAARSVIAGAIGVGVVAYFAGKAIAGAGLGETPQTDTSTSQTLRRPVRP
jgi:hypothetical protein